MKIINTIKVFFICLILGMGFCTVVSMMAAVQMFPEGKSGNKYVDYLLSNVTIQAVAEDDIWSEKYPYEKNMFETYVENISEIKKTVDSYCTVSFPGSKMINDIVTYFKFYVYYYHASEIPALFENWNYVQGPIKNVINFQAELKEMDIPFLYVQTPAPETIKYHNGETLEKESLMIAERSYSLTSSLEESEVNIINIGRDYSEDIMFDTSLHWWPKDALTCTSIIAEELNNNYGFQIEETIYGRENFENILDDYKYENEKIKENCGYSYEFLVPINENELKYEIIYAEKEKKAGSFNEVLLRECDKWGLGNGAPYQDMYYMHNSLMYEITNYSAKEEKEILVIGDSSNWAVSTYLSLGVKHITVLHNSTFSGSILNYIRQKQPDIVIMVYNDAEFWDIYTEEAYYLE